MDAINGEGQRLSVLIVEDDVDTADSEAMLLEFIGYRVRAARDGPTALDLIEEEVPDVVLMDIGLPGMNGYSLARNIRALLLDRPPMLVAISGYAGQEPRRRAEEAGIHYYLVKPADIPALSTMLDRLQSLLLLGTRPGWPSIIPINVSEFAPAHHELAR